MKGIPLFSGLVFLTYGIFNILCIFLPNLRKALWNMTDEVVARYEKLEKDNLTWLLFSMLTIAMMYFTWFCFAATRFSFCYWDRADGGCFATDGDWAGIYLRGFNNGYGYEIVAAFCFGGCMILTGAMLGKGKTFSPVGWSGVGIMGLLFLLNMIGPFIHE